MRVKAYVISMIVVFNCFALGCAEQAPARFSTTAGQLAIRFRVQVSTV